MNFKESHSLKFIFCAFTLRKLHRFTNRNLHRPTLFVYRFTSTSVLRLWVYIDLRSSFIGLHQTASSFIYRFTSNSALRL